MKKLSSEFQHLVIRLMMDDDLFCQRASLYLKKDYFNNKYLAWFFGKCEEYFQKYHKRPSQQYLTDQLNFVIEENEGNNYAEVLARILSVPKYDREHVIDDLETFIKTSEFKKLHIKAAEHFNSGEYKQAFSYTRAQLDKIEKIKLRHEDYMTKARMLEILERSSSGSLVEEVDIMGMEFPKWNEQETWNGKIPKKGVSTIIAPWNVGKTTFMINCAYHAAKSGHKVLFVLHEGREEQIVLKLIARIANLPYNAVKAKLLNEQEMVKVHNAMDFIEQNIRIKEVTKVGNTVEELVTLCKSISQVYKFDLLIDDYGQKLGVQRSKRELRHDHNYIWNTFDQLAHELNIAILTAAQINREGSKMNKGGSQILRSENLSESIAPAQVSEMTFTMNRSSEDKQKDKWILCLDKTRDGLDGLLIECNSMFGRSITHDKDLGMKVIGFDIGKGRGDEPEQELPRPR